MTRAVATLLLIALPALPAAAQRRVPTTELGIDVVTLADGTRLLGAVTARTERVVTLAVRRAWLRENAPERLQAVAASEQEQHARSARRVLERIAAWRTEVDPATHGPLGTFLDAEHERLSAAFDEAERTPPPASEFVLLALPVAEVRRVHVQRPSQRTIALLAWRERLADVESRAADELRRDLERRRVPAPSKPVDLSDRLPAGITDDDGADSWAARRAIVEYHYVTPLDFQGTGELLVRTTGDRQPGLEQVLAAFVPRARPLDLLELVDPPKGAAGPAAPKPDGGEFATAIEEAERLGANGFRVTRVAPDLDRQRVAVESQFVAKLPAGWKPVWTWRTTADASQPRPELERRIADDERVAEIARTIRALGVGEAPLATALRFGAATMAAQTEVDDAFFDFTESTTKSLDAPWPRASDTTQ